MGAVDMVLMDTDHDDIDIVEYAYTFVLESEK